MVQVLKLKLGNQIRSCFVSGLVRYLGAGGQGPNMTELWSLSSRAFHWGPEKSCLEIFFF